LSRYGFCQIPKIQEKILPFPAAPQKKLSQFLLHGQPYFSATLPHSGQKRIDQNNWFREVMFSSELHKINSISLVDRHSSRGDPSAFEKSKTFDPTTTNYSNEFQKK
jgi:hypothetical protein